MDKGAAANSKDLSMEREFGAQASAGLKRRSVSLAQQEAMKSLQLQQKDSPKKPGPVETAPPDVLPDADEWVRLEEMRNHLLRDLADRRRRTTARYRTALSSHLAARRAALEAALQSESVSSESSVTPTTSDEATALKPNRLREFAERSVAITNGLAKT